MGWGMLPSEPGGEEGAALAGRRSPWPVGRGAGAALRVGALCRGAVRGHPCWIWGLPVATVVAPITPGPAFPKVFRDLYPPMSDQERERRK